MTRLAEREGLCARRRQSRREQRVLRPSRRAREHSSGYRRKRLFGQRFRESRDQGGELTYIADHEERLRLLASMPLVDVDAGRELTVAERFDLK